MVVVSLGLSDTVEGGEVGVGHVLIHQAPLLPGSGMPAFSLSITFPFQPGGLLAPVREAEDEGESRS